MLDIAICLLNLHARFEEDPNDDEQEWVDVPSDEEQDTDAEEFFKFLSNFENKGQNTQFQENLKKIVRICQDMKNPDLFNIIQNYNFGFQGLLFMAEVFQMDPEPIQIILEKIHGDLAEIQATHQQEEGTTLEALQEDAILLQNVLLFHNEHSCEDGFDMHQFIFRFLIFSFFLVFIVIFNGR